jgi:CO/xanthine dehydrogenase Mo-binding subunit
VFGRGIAYVQRGATRVAIVAEVEVDRSSGRIWARKFTVAHDRGQIIIPDGLRHTIEGNLVQGISRALWEEVGFDRKRVTSVDWLTYPILDVAETPEAIDIVLIDRECQIFCVWGPVSLPRDIVAIDWGSITS